MRILLNRKDRLQNLVRTNKSTLDKSVTNIDELIQKNRGGDRERGGEREREGRESSLSGTNQPMVNSSYRTINESPRYQSTTRPKINN